MLRRASRPLDDADLAALPTRVGELARNLPPVSAWIPEVVVMTYMIALRDVHFPPPGGDAAYARWTYDRNRRLLGGRLYRALFLLVSPERLFNHVGGRSGRIRRGSTLELVEHRLGYAKLQTHYPSFLHDESLALGMRAAFRAAAELAGAKWIEMEPPLVEERATTFELRYGT